MVTRSLPASCHGLVQDVVGSVELPIGSLSISDLVEGFHGIGMLLVSLVVQRHEGSGVYEQPQRMLFSIRRLSRLSP